MANLHKSKIGRRHLRSAGIVLAGAFALLSATAYAAWKEHPYQDLGFVVEFPEEPAAATANYRTVLVESAPVHIFSVKQPDATYVASVVDFQNRATDGARLLIEAEFQYSLLGDVTATEISRVEPGKAAVFGHFVTIDCRNDKAPDQPGQTEAAQKWFKTITGGLECPNKARLTVNLLFNNGRLYLIQGMNMPNPDGTTALSPAALRFTNSVSLYSADGMRNRADGGKE